MGGGVQLQWVAHSSLTPTAPVLCSLLQAFGIVKGQGEATDLMFALLFGLVAGMMIAISFMEILPTAYL